MIRLIATDMDGTLLNDKKELPHDFYEVLDKLKKSKINFTISSGRSYATLKQLFAEKADEMSFICDNGAYIVSKGKLISRSILPKELVNEVIRLGNEENLLMLLCGMNGTYHNSSSEKQHTEIAQYYTNQIHLDNLLECDDDIFKIAVFDQRGIEENGYKFLKRHLGENVNMQISGKYWTDIMNPQINKGNAIKILQNNLGIEYEDTMAFGDFLNDIEMLTNAYYSYAMSNSHPYVKKAANFSTGSNNEESVTKEILRLIYNQ